MHSGSGNSKSSRSYLSIIYLVLFAFLTLNIASNLGKWERNQIFHYDVCGYHNYLPALFIYHDLAHFRYIDSIETKYTIADQKRYALYDIPKTGKVCNQYPVGVAIFQAPFFLIAHALCQRDGKFPADGYSAPYQHTTFISTWFYVILGLFFLRKFLVAYFNDMIVLLALIICTIGTNLYIYTVQEPGLSHPYLFFLYACILYLTNRLYRKPSWMHAILLGICLGLCAITRPLDVLIFLIPLFWTTPGTSALSKLSFLLEHKYKLLALLLFALLTVLPQLVYWKEMTGEWLYYSYSEKDYFQFKQFNIIKGLFSYRKGWFLYSPLLILGFIGALLMSRSKDFKFYFWPFWLFFVPMIFLVFSWHMWTYGWSFSCRALMETIPLLAFPIAFVLSKLSSLKLKYIVPAGIITIFLLALSAFQIWQYEQNILQGDAMSKKSYWAIFGKTSINGSELDSLIKEQRVIDQKEGNGL